MSNAAGKFFSSTPGHYVIAGGVVLIVGAVVWQYFKDFFKEYTEGTAYADAGAVGALGKGVDDLSGGLFSSVGGALGRTLYDWTHNDETITDQVELMNVSFPDGKTRAIAKTRVTNGQFEYQGVRYRLGVDPAGGLHAYAL
jgi:hypothetical protein